MRTRFPTVWSSRCSVKVAALVTFVSFSRDILCTKHGKLAHTIDGSKCRLDCEDLTSAGPLAPQIAHICQVRSPLLTPNDVPA